MHMAALNLSVVLLDRVTPEARVADAQDDVAEMQRDVVRRRMLTLSNP